MLETRTRIAEGGRLIIPASFRRALHIEPGEELILRLEDGELRLFSLNQSIKRAQAIVQKYNQSRQNLSEKLFEMRSQENTHD